MGNRMIVPERQHWGPKDQTNLESVRIRERALKPVPASFSSSQPRISIAGTLTGRHCARTGCFLRS